MSQVHDGYKALKKIKTDPDKAQRINELLEKLNAGKPVSQGEKIGN